MGEAAGDDETYSLGTFEVPATMNLAASITAAEYEELRAALAAIERLGMPFDYGLVERNFSSMKGMYQFVTVVLSLGRKFAMPNHRQLGESLMGSIVNWLTGSAAISRPYRANAQEELRQRLGPGAALQRGNQQGVRPIGGLQVLLQISELRAALWCVAL